MPYEELVEYLKECCIYDIPVSMTSVLNTIEQSDKIRIDFITIANKGSTYDICYKHGGGALLSPVYRIDISKIDNRRSTSIIFNYDKDIYKINKVLFISETQSNTVGTCCKNIKEFTN